MEPIISPWVIYLFSVLSKLNIVASAVAIFSVASIIFIAFTKFTFGDDMEIPFNYKYVIIVLITSTVLTIIIPDRQTMLSMLTLSFITPDNIGLAEDHIIDLIIKIMDAAKHK